MSRLPHVEMYTDGACLGNPGAGGWGVLLRHHHHEKELNGGEPHTTNNRMELRAAIEGLKALKKTSQVDLYTDSEYVKNGITTWIEGWIARGWKTADRKPVKNQDLWQDLHALTHTHRISWHWVRGHDGHPENERVDVLARTAAEDIRESEQRREKKEGKKK